MDFYWFSLKTWIINTQHSFIRRKLTWINKVSSLWWKFHEYPWKPSLFAAKKLKYRHAIIKLFFSFTFRRISRFALTTQFEFWCSYSIDMKKPADKIESEKLFCVIRENSLSLIWNNWILSRGRRRRLCLLVLLMDLKQLSIDPLFMR